MAKRTGKSSVVKSSLTPEAEQYLQEVERRRINALGRISRLPIACLIWGPSPNGNSPVSLARMNLRSELMRCGHLADFSEELIEENSGFSIQAQELSHAEAHDIVFSIPDSPGSIAEIHDFAKIPWLSNKIITFLDRRWNDGYANRSLIEFQSNVTSAIVLYETTDLPKCITEKALEFVRRLQELHYMMGRRI